MERAVVDRIKAVTVAVRDQEEALSWYVEKLGFEVKADIGVPGFRWLTVAPKGQEDTEFLLASWFPDHVGRNATCVLHTKNCRAGYRTLVDRGVVFAHPPQPKPYGGNYALYIPDFRCGFYLSISPKCSSGELPRTSAQNAV